MHKMLPAAAGLLAMMSFTPAFAQSTSVAKGHETVPNGGTGAPGPAMTSGNMGVPTTKFPAVTPTEPSGAGATGEVGGHSAASTSTAAGSPTGKSSK